jgi:hypothetical protein
MTSFVSAPAAVPLDHGPVLGDPLVKYSAGSMPMRMLLHSIRDVSYAILSIVKQVPGGESSPGRISRNFDQFALLSCHSVAYSSLDAIAAMTRVRVQDPLSCIQK